MHRSVQSYPAVLRCAGAHWRFDDKACSDRSVPSYEGSGRNRTRGSRIGHLRPICLRRRRIWRQRRPGPAGIGHGRCVGRGTGHIRPTDRSHRAVGDRRGLGRTPMARSSSSWPPSRGGMRPRSTDPSNNPPGVVTALAASAVRFGAAASAPEAARLTVSASGFAPGSSVLFVIRYVPATSAGSSGSSGGGGILPVTGSDPQVMVGIGLGLLVLGGAAYTGTRRRRHRTAVH